MDFFKNNANANYNNDNMMPLLSRVITLIRDRSAMKKFMHLLQRANRMPAFRL